MSTKSLVASGCYTRTGPPAEIRADLIQITQHDRRVEQRARVYTYSALACAAGGILGILAAGYASHVGLVGLGVAVGLLGVAVVLGVLAWDAGGLDIPDGRYETLTKLTGLLGADLPAKGTLDVHMDLRRTDCRPHLSSEFDKDLWKVKLYINPCLRISGRLADGNKFCLVVTERQEQRRRWERSRSGKSKLKQKTKSSLKFDVMVRPDVDRYGSPNAMEKLFKEAARVPPHINLIDTQTTPTEVRLRAVGPSHPGLPEYGSAADTVAMLLLSIYQCLNFHAASRTGQRGASR